MQLPSNLPSDLTLRDYIAAKALSGIVGRNSYQWNNENAHILAQSAYKVADAMLAERAK